MNSSTFSLLIDLIILAYGGYSLYSVYMMKQSGKIHGEKMILPKDLTPERCQDTAGFIAAICPKLTIVGAMALFSGILSLLIDVANLTMLVIPNSILMILFFIGLIWYVKTTKPIVAKCWGIKEVSKKKKE